MPTISKTGLDYIDHSPLDYWFKFVSPEREPYVEDKKTFFNKALRLAVTDFSEFQDEYVKISNINARTTIGKAELASLKKLAESNCQKLIEAEKYNTIVNMRASIMNHSAASVLFSKGKTGSVEKLTEPESGAVIVFNPHWIYKNELSVNVLSTSDASAENFSKEAFNMNLHKKAAIHIDGCGVQNVVFLMVEEKPPYKVQLHTLDNKSIELGRETVVKNCKTLVECLKSGKWPGLPEKIEPVSLPAWAFK